MNCNVRSVLIALSVSVAFAPVGARAQTAITHQISLPSGMTWCSDSMINGLFSQINAFRTQRGVAPLAMSTLGMKDAELRAVRFASYMATANPSQPGFNPHQGWDTTAAGIGYNVVSENLAFVTSDPGYIVGQIWQDPLHLAAMLAADANVAGVSCVYNNGYPYWTYEPGACTGASCPAGPTPNPPPTPGGASTLDSEEWAFLTLINQYRAQNGLGALQVSASLQNASRWMSGDMAAKNYLNHTDSQGRSTGARIAAFGYTYSPWGENIAAGLATAQQAFDGWLNACDPDASGACTYAHRRNMLGAGFRAIGIARAFGAGTAYGWYWTTDFGGVVDQVVTPPGGPVTPSAPAIGSFGATPSSVTAGRTATLTWSVTGATSVTIDNGIGSVAGSGSRSVTPSQTTTYTLTASNAAGSVTARATVTVTPATPNPTDTTAPSAPALTSAVARSANQVDLAWAGSSDNVAVTGYQILRNGSALATAGAAARSYSDMSAAPSTTYQYAVRAFDAAGNYSAASNSVQATTPASAGSTFCPYAGSNAFTGCYFNNPTLSGNPVLTRTDEQINFDWGVRPDPALPAQPFSVRWQGDFLFAGGPYQFTATTSDGMRVYVDEKLVIDRWQDQAPSIFTGQQSVTMGFHRITVEYYAKTGRATAHVTWQKGSATPQAPAIQSFTASPATVTAGRPSTLSWSVSGASTITVDQGVGDVTGLSSKSVQPTQTTTYKLTASNTAGSVTATATVTVGAAADTQAPTTPALSSAVARSSTEVALAWSASADNVAVAGYQILRNGSPLKTVSAATLAYADTSVLANTAYTYSVKAFDAAGNYSAASNTISVTTPAGAPSGAACGVAAVGSFSGCYYVGPNLSGRPALSRGASQVNFDWGQGSPDSSLPAGNFSARWQGYFDFDSGVYTFVAQVSGGVRVTVDGYLVIDDWRDQPATTAQGNIWLPRGSHLVTVEYFSPVLPQVASAHLTWQK